MYLFILNILIIEFLVHVQEGEQKVLDLMGIFKSHNPLKVSNLIKQNLEFKKKKISRKKLLKKFSYKNITYKIEKLFY